MNPLVFPLSRQRKCFFHAAYGAWQGYEVTSFNPDRASVNPLKMIQQR
jgi:hypothetical protein